MQKIRWGVLGTASFARSRMIGVLQESGDGEVVAIGSRDAARAAAVARDMGIPRSYGSYEAVIADPAVDAVYIPLPVGLHAEWAIRCAQAGKPTLCEKPLTANAAEARAVADAFESRGVPLVEGLMYRHHPLTRKVKAMVDEGAIGELQVIRASFTVTPPGENNFRHKRELGGGAMLDLGVYCVSLIRLLAGEEPDRVHAVGVFGPQTDVDEWLAAVMRFPTRRVVGYLGVSQRAQFDCSYDVTGSRGRLLVELGAMVAWPGTDFKIRAWRGDQYEEIVVPAANHYALMVADFHDMLRRKRPPTYAIRDSVRNMEVIDRILAAAR